MPDLRVAKAMLRGAEQALASHDRGCDACSLALLQPQNLRCDEGELLKVTVANYTANVDSLAREAQRESTESLF